MVNRSECFLPHAAGPKNSDVFGPLPATTGNIPNRPR